jgi:hypothetical protein
MGLFFFQKKLTRIYITIKFIYMGRLYTVAQQALAKSESDKQSIIDE